jgi:hypothetical protein
VYYEQGERSPDAIYLALVATHGMDVQYILTGERRGVASGGVGASAEESALLDCWRELATRQQRLMAAVMREFCSEAARSYAGHPAQEMPDCNQRALAGDCGVSLR